MKTYFFNKTLSFFKDHKIQNKAIIMGVSGGLDSIVLLDLLKELSSVCRLKLYVVHIHHGKALKTNIQTYRDKTKKLVLKLCKDYQLEFISPKIPTKVLKSEEEFRKLRHNHFTKILKQKKADLIALAHKQEDLLETRLIQLIRGCGFQGLKGMSSYEPPYLRPLLFWTKEEIKSYAKQKNLKWLEDPSNRDNRFLRNWIRNKWLMELERKRAGSVKAFSRSLDTICLNKAENFIFKTIDASKGINRKLLTELSLTDQKRVLASYMRQLNLSNYGQSHIQEILKHNERIQKKLSLKILKKTWIFTNNYIKAH